MVVMRARLKAVLVVVVFLLLLVVTFTVGRKSASSLPSTQASLRQGSAMTPKPASPGAANSDLAPTNVYAHNLMLRKGPSFRVYVRWLRGQMARAHRNVDPSFDDPESFFLDIKNGVLRANIGDLAKFLNTAATKSPLTNITLSGDGDQIKLRGTLHKVVSFPVELIGTISALQDNRIQVRITKLNLLKIPFKGLLGTFNVKLADLFHPEGIPGVQITGNDIFFDTQTLLPPPHIRGQLTKIHIVNPDLEEVYGDAQEDVERVEQWRNFLRLSGGTIDFGKLTMHHVDLIMIDISKDPWFDLDLANYQDQLVNGYTRMTPQAGLQIFMPDRRELPKNSAKPVSIEWFKNRNNAPPADVVKK